MSVNTFSKRTWSIMIDSSCIDLACVIYGPEVREELEQGDGYRERTDVRVVVNKINITILKSCGHLNLSTLNDCGYNDLDQEIAPCNKNKAVCCEGSVEIQGENVKSLVVMPKYS